MADTNPDAHLDEDELLSSGNSDIDESTEEGRARLERREAIFSRSTRRQVEEQLAEARSKIPAVAFEIPASLYTKAATLNGQLTDAERALFRSRGDLVGRALADPDTLTLEEAYRAMLWPAPDVVRANVQQVTGGRVDGPAELFAEVKAGRILTVAECSLVMGKFCAGQRRDGWSELNLETPGLAEADTLVFARRFHPEGLRALLAPSLVGKDMVAVAMAATQPLGASSNAPNPPQPPPEPTPSSAPPVDDMPIWIPRPVFNPRPLINPALYSEDKVMPDLSPPIPPLGLFRDEFRAVYGAAIAFEEITNHWNQLSEEQQTEYTHRTRAINQAAQDEFMRKLEEGYRALYRPRRESRVE